jgi:hypothetical protein
MPSVVENPPTQEQEATEDQRVAVDDPREVLLRDLEVLPDRRQGDVGDGRIQDDDELRNGEQHQGEPLAAFCGDVFRGHGAGSGIKWKEKSVSTWAAQ